MTAAVAAVAVVGHTELVEFAAVPRLPLGGEIVHCDELLEVAAGGGAVAATELARLTGACVFYTALGAGDAGTRAQASLRGRPGLDVQTVRRRQPQRRALSLVDPGGERTILVLGARMGPRGSDRLEWERLAACDAVYFTAGDARALRLARSARVLVATTRAFEVLVEGAVAIDAIVLSDRDEGERVDAGMLDPPPDLVFRTRGADGGVWEASDGTAGSWEAIAPPGPVLDTYGAGDCFAAGVTLGLGRGLDPCEAAALGAACGARALTRRGP